MGTVVINLSLENIWVSWFAFRKGKRATPELDEFQYELEKSLRELHDDLNRGVYRHGPYRIFTVCDNKKRVISVAPVRDRVVHRLIYDYLVSVFDETFLYDAWSCRKGKGLLGAIERAQEFMRKNPRAFVWRADIRKFFDSVDHGVLLGTVFRKVQNPKARWLIGEVVSSFPCTPEGAERERERVL
jgi:retron-type reverse transcriptase